MYRATSLPYWFGSQGQLKANMGSVVAGRALGLVCDVSTRPEDTIVGDKWIDFMASGKTVLGCESGSSVLDSHGQIREQIRTLLRSNPDLTFEEVSQHMPPGWDDYQFFAISPRHFEAVLTKTCQVLVEGYYDGVLEADKHYIAIKRDFSNLDEVLVKIRDTALLQAIADQAYNDIYLSGKHTYQQFARQIEQAIAAHEQYGERRDAINSMRWRVGAPLAGVASDLELASGQLKRKLFHFVRDQLLRRQPL
jgi:hypothetical protein